MTSARLENSSEKTESDSSSDKWSYRGLQASDVEMVLKTWIGTYRNSLHAGVIPNNRFTEITTDAINQLFKRGAQGLAAVNPDCPEHILGYVVSEVTRMGEPVCHYVFVRDLYRRQGMAKELLKKAGVDPSEPFLYTFRTSCASWFGKKAKYVPVIARRKNP